MQYKITDFNGNEKVDTVENIEDCVFFYGGGNADTSFTTNEQILGFGSFVIIPEVDFVGWV